MRPRRASASRLAGKCTPPTSSRITSALRDGPRRKSSSRTISAPRAARLPRGALSGRWPRPAPRRDAELNGGGADPAASTVDEQRLAGAQPGLRECGVVRGDERLGHRGAPLVERVGHARQAALVHDDTVGEPAAADEPEDAVARLPGRDALPAALHRSGDLETGDVRRTPGRSGVVTRPLDEVGGVEAGERDPNEDVLRAGRGRAAPRRRRPRSPGAGEDDRSHAARLRSSASAGAEALPLVVHVGAVVEALDREVEVAVAEAVPQRRRSDAGDRPRPRPDSGSGRRSRAGGSRRRSGSTRRRSPSRVPPARAERARDHRHGIVERRDRVDEVEEDARRAAGLGHERAYSSTVKSEWFSRAARRPPRRRRGASRRTATT